MKVSLAHNVPVTTVNRVLHEFHDNDGMIVVNKRGRNSIQIPQNVREQILQPERLQRWAAYSLRDRVTLC